MLLFTAIITVLCIGGNAQTTLFSCNFEFADLCGMVTGTYTASDGVASAIRDDWVRTNGETPTGNGNRLTGPVSAQDGQFYIFFEASFRSSGPLSGEITSPFITYSQQRNFRLNLYFHDHGSALGPLTLRILSSQGVTLQDVVINDGRNPTENWNFTSVPFNEPGTNFRFQIIGSTTSRPYADWGVDNIQIVADNIVSGCNTNPCVAGATCTDNASSYFCTCPSGFAGNGEHSGTGCTDINECLNSPCPGGNSVACVNLAGSYTCQCAIGYQLVSGSGSTIVCIDTNECLANPCTGNNVNCVNNAGSYSCQCMSGYQTLSGSGNTLTCMDINECLTNSNYCLLNSNTQCVNTAGTATCSCLNGYIPDSGSGETLICRTDLVNECIQNPCPGNSFCSDTQSSYTCNCNAGYERRTGSGTDNTIICDDIDECASVTCDVDASCFNLVATYECRCNSGYTQVGVQINARCHRDGGLSTWSDSTSCSTTCGVGQKTQMRSCTNPSHEVGGEPCDPEEARIRTVECNITACPGCAQQKPCTCGSITQYTTGNEPNSALTHFTGITPNDIDAAVGYLAIWAKDHFTQFCKDARCDTSVLNAACVNMTNYIDSLIAIDTSNNEALASMKEIINCNENIDIELNLWVVYDMLCDRSVSIGHIKRDLMLKKKMMMDEMERCESRTWFGSMVETFNKRF